MKKPNTLRAPQIRVLIVDNHSLIRRGVAAILGTESDFAIVAQTDNAGALGVVQTLKPDVVVLDLTLRGGEGLDVIKTIAYDPRTKVLALDLHGEGTYATRAIKLGAKGYLTTDVDAGLAPALRRIHAGQLSVSDEIAQQMLASLTQHHANPNEPIETLSNRELEVAEAVGKGLSASEVAKTLKISIKTVETHKAHMKRKIGVATSAQLTRYCVAWFEQRNRK